MALPGNPELATVLDGIITSPEITEPAPDIREAALQSALGLTTTEAENAFALSVVETRAIDPAVIAREKARMFKKNGLIEIVESTTSLEHVGGLKNLKNWLIRRAGAFLASAKFYGLRAPKGLLIVSIPGIGKSLTAKATACAFGLLQPNLQGGSRKNRQGHCQNCEKKALPKTKKAVRYSGQNRQNSLF